MGLTVHMVANAHLDPVWLWPWQAGRDALLDTDQRPPHAWDDYRGLSRVRRYETGGPR